MDVAQANQAVHDLQNQVVHHKAEIRRHKQELRWTAEALAKLTAKCQALGIKVTTQPKGVGEHLHGRSQSTP